MDKPLNGAPVPRGGAEMMSAFHINGLRSRLMPRPVRARLVFEMRDLIRLFHRKADVVETVQEAMFAMRIDVELDDTAIRAADLLRFEIDGQRRIGAALGIVHQLGEILAARP